ncbi:MAG: hypothetical protein KDD58_02925 [Bdellovibrionales bacterium]|nr:hypothetical protein [Bdellovibrionales bacterium]
MGLSKAFFLSIVLSSNLGTAATQSDKIEGKINEILFDYKSSNFDIDEEISKQNALAENRLDRDSIKKELDGLESEEHQRVQVKLINKETIKH